MPVLISCIAFEASRVSDRIFLCDILESNRAEVERFRAGDDNAHSFARYFDFVAGLEGAQEEEDVELRTRNAIKVTLHITRISRTIFGHLMSQSSIFLTGHLLLRHHE